MFKTSLCIVLLGMLGVAAMAQDRPVINVWPDKVPGEKGDIGEEKYMDPPTSTIKRLGNVSKPTLTIFEPAKDKKNGAAIIICPGGGYSILAWDLEGTEVAEWANSNGVTAIILKYRVPQRKGQEERLAPFQDAQRTVSLVRSKAGELGIDPKRIGILGFSAGGHLSARTAIQYEKRSYEPVDDADKVSCRPDFAVLIYPAYLVDKTGQLTAEMQVNAQTPPMFLAHAGDDKLTPENSISMYLALHKAGVPSELHVYASAGHGFGLRASKHPAYMWPQRCAEWMKSRGLLEPVVVPAK